MALNDDLKAWWMLNEESGTRYDTHGSNDLTDYNTVLYGTGKVGNAADFELGNDETLYIADNADLSFGDEDFCIAGWFKLETVTATMGLVTKFDYTNDDREYALYFDTAADTAKFAISDDGATQDATVEATTKGALSAATWYFVYCYHDAANNQIGISVDDGTVDTEAHATGCNDNISVFELGRFDDDTAAFPYDGLMDEVGIWGRVLSSAEVTALYNSGDGVTYTYRDTPAAVSAIAASTAPQVRERITNIVASAIATVTAPQVRVRITNIVASAIAATTAPVVAILKTLFARFHDYFLTAPQRFSISSNKAQMTARYRDYNLTAPQRERYG